MRIGNKLKKRLSKINSFLSSKKKPGTEDIHLLRLEVKHLEAFLLLMTVQKDFSASPEIPRRLEKLFHNAGKIRKFELENKAIRSLTNDNEIFRPALILGLLNASKRKMIKNLRKKRRTYQPFEPGDFAKHPDSKLSQHTWQQFMDTQAESILNLLEGDILSDIRSLHQLRKILKSILYVLPIGENPDAPDQAYLEKHKEFMKSIESKIGSIHDTDFFIGWLGKKHDIEQGPGQGILEKIIKVWKNDIEKMKDELRPLLPVIRQLALDLKQIILTKNTVSTP
jgi:hypothetical protein